MSVAYHGERFGGYRLIELIGCTAMATVHRAVDPAGRTVALKILDGHPDGPARQHLLHVSAMVRDLHHPHIVPIHEAGEAEGRLFIATRYVPGGDLAGLLAGGRRLDPHRAVALLTEVAGALDAVHAHGLVHGGVKPANILVDTSDGIERAYLTDVGTPGDRGSGDTTAAGTSTPEYLAPEQVDGGSTDARTDVHALGCVVRRCLDPTHRLSAGLDEIVARALAMRKDDRYPSATAFLTAVRRAIAEPGYHDPAALALRNRPASPRPRWLWSPLVATAVTGTALAAATGVAIGVHHGVGGGAQNTGSATALVPRIPTHLLAPRSTASAPTPSPAPSTPPSPVATPGPEVASTIPLATPSAAPTQPPGLPITPPLSGGNLFSATVHNTGQTDLVAGASSLSSVATAAIVHDGCAGAHLAPGGSCQVTVRVQPSAPLGSSTVLSVPLSDGKPVTFTLPGIGG